MESALLDPSILQPASFSGNFQDGTRWIVRVEDYTELDKQQLGEVKNLTVKLLAYSVEVMGPESQKPEVRLHTLKLVKSQLPLGVNQ
jgi:hypothetical protein